ncbi:ATP citrate synthase [bacterium]|jgi:ATP-citrate lyase alpha-subunit|nr:ATP citrate synthase [bacterium]
MSALFTNKTQAIFWNNNVKAIQRMLDYDYICGREKPSVSAIVHATSENSFQKFFFGVREVLVPIYKSTKDAVDAQPEADTFLNFASFRTAYDVTMEALEFPSLKTLMITAEGIPERLAQEINIQAKKLGRTIIGPATVGAITPGCFKVANIGGSIDNIVKTKLHKIGSVGLVTRSGGLFNELANIISIKANGLAEGVAIGGDRFPGSSYLDHMLRMEKNPDVKFMVLLGEVGGSDEYDIIEAKKSGQLTKPIIGWCIGTVGQYFQGPVQFGHAGANANQDKEKASIKNEEMKKAGIRVPKNFNNLPELIEAIYHRLLAEGTIDKETSKNVPNLPEDYTAAINAGKIRKETNFICTISDDRGAEANYAGVPISQLAMPDTGYNIGDVISLLWFKKRFPKWTSDFIESVIKTVADHGPAVSGAHNARVSARAGKDLISSLCSGILTIGPKFGGAIDGAAKYFKYALDNNLDPREFVADMKKKNIPIPGIGHRIKSVRNPDKRVEELKRYAKEYFPSCELLKYAEKVEQVTTAKKDTLILNVDGTIGVLMVDMWRNNGYSETEIDELIRSGTLNAFFVIGRTIGFIGHILDEKRLNMPLYRHQFDDILYDVKEAEELAPVTN